jgi:hypothetical protein
MTVRHTVLLRWAPEATPERIEEITAALRALPGAIPELRSYRVGSDAGLAEDSWDYAIWATFDSVEGYEIYRDHPRHQAVIAELIRPVLADRAASQVVEDEPS